MSWPGYDRRDLYAIAGGGSLGATLRWWLARPVEVDSVLVWDPPELADVAFAPPIEGGNLLIIIYGFPVGTLMVNLLGCLILGGLTVSLRRSASAANRRVLVAAAAGFCGSLTTFSSFAVEVAERFRGRPVLAGKYSDVTTHFDPAVADGLLYLAVSVIGGGLAFWLGRFVAERSVHSPGERTLGDAK